MCSCCCCCRLLLATAVPAAGVVFCWLLQVLLLLLLLLLLQGLLLLHLIGTAGASFWQAAAPAVISNLNGISQGKYADVLCTCSC
jgi:hypothetical protein